MAEPIPIINGIYTDQVGDFRTSYPVNLMPVPKSQGVSEGFLRPADGLITQGTGPGKGRGGFNWNNVCYRVMGSKLIKILADGTNTVLGDVEDDGLPVTMINSFDRLAIASNQGLFYWKESNQTLTKVTDPDLGIVLNVEWIDGYFITTDGENIVQTELTDPTSIDPFKYGSSEVNPDKIVGVIELRDELCAVNRFTIESFENVGGTGFVFTRIDGSLMTKGAIGTHAFCVFSVDGADTLAFLGSGPNEPPGVYLGANGQVIKVSTNEIDILLQDYDEDTLSQVIVEARSNKTHKQIYIHLPNKTMVYDQAASKEVGVPVWFFLTSTLDEFELYRARSLVWCYNNWLCEDPKTSNYGVMVDNISSHYGTDIRWEFGTTITYAGGQGVIVNNIELIALTGRVALGKNPTIRTSWSTDGLKWSNERAISVGTIGNTNKRLLWEPQGGFTNWRIQRFRSDSQAFISFAQLIANFEKLAY
jgi:hypothetical protein